ncbi:cholinesterase isoform X2 [Bradysia coprophila]|uniref:cholinesterase isoform X2 n=1 Tax=Bradysia coprophila TaxID=38358 RepID=UPI00187D9645|nr:cholinesterase isoform X2 [Bradysia coprophila]
MATHNNRKTLHRCNKTVNNCCDRHSVLVKPPKFDKYFNEMTQQSTNRFRRKKSIFLVNEVIWCCTIVIALLPIVAGQYTTRDPRFYSREGDFTYKWPNPGDPDYRTYTFNDRRYGHYQPDGYGSQYPGQKQAGQYPAGVPLGEDKFKYDPNNPQNVQTPFPGVLGGWRPDLQGKQRRDSLILDRDIFVTTNYGQVQGFKVRLFDDPDPKSFYRPWHSTVDRVTGEVQVFLGIPYALPPTFEGRFKPPRPHRGWQLLQAVDFGPACPQPVRFTGATKGIRDMDEDCLYLNVYSPNVAAGVPQKYPVMVWIHGGDFHHGASNLFPGHIMAAFYKVVVVTINYRLGALGFLATGDENSPGNYGILDQAMAIKWVYDNAEFFNGDRSSITLFGPGAGAASAGLLMVAPQTRDIVTKVIAQSGSATADWALIVDKYRAQNTSRVYGQVLGCSIESSWKLVNCLRQGRSFYELGNAEFNPHVGTFPWGPVLENATTTFPGDNWYEGWREQDWHFLKETPQQLIKKRMFNRGLQYMTGVTMQEAAYVIYQNESLAPFYEVDQQFFDQKVRELVLRYNYTLNPNGVYEAMKYMYTYWPNPTNKTHIREQYIHLLSDFLYRAPVDHMVKLLVEQNVPVYMYVMNTTVEGLKLQEWRKVPHDAEHFFLTGAPFMDVEFFPRRARLDRNMWTDNDRNMSHFFMKTFTDFARFGNPTPQQVLGIHFDRARNGELKYLNLNTTYNSSVLLNFRQTESAFWTQYLPTVIGVLVPTYPPSTEFWWEPREPLQIAFWSMAAACMLLMVLVVICCMLWRNAKRQTDRFYDGDMFIDQSEIERDDGIENHIIQNPSRGENIYQYRDTPSGKPTKSHQDSHSIRSPSSLTMTQTTKTGSQNSLRSAISLKDTAVSPTSKDSSTFEKNLKYSERSVDPNPNGSKYDDNRQQGPTPVPSTRKSLKTSKTHLIEGIPQTEV